MSASLQWMLIRDNSSFLVKNKKNGLAFSREPNNLRNVNSFGSNGLIHKKTLNVCPTKKGVIVMTKKSTKALHPNKSFVSSTHKGGMRSINKSVRNIAKTYRSDLTRDALARATALMRTQLNGKVYKKLKSKIGKRSRRHLQRK